MTDWGKRVLFGSLLGAMIGVLLGLALSRILWPVAQAPPPVSPTPTGAQPEATLAQASPVSDADDGHDEALVLVSALYAVDGDLERARERMVALGLDDPSEAVVDLALRHAAAGNRQVATDLATLAAALGHQQGDLLAYVATPTLTPTPLPTHTPTPMPTPTLIPSLTPTPQPSPTPSHTPSPTAASPKPTRQPPPVVPTATPPPVATPLSLEWDLRVNLLDPPIKLVAADVAPGQPYWRLVLLDWLKANEGGNTMLYVSTLNENGRPAWGQEVVVEHGVKESLYTDPKPGEPYGANYPMSNTLNSYQVYVGGDLPSERVVGLGLGEWYGGLDHTTFVLVFQRSK